MITSPSPENPQGDRADPASPARDSVSRRGVITGIAAVAGLAVAVGATPAAAAGRGREGTVSGAGDLPGGFTGTFKDRYVDANGIRQHIVIGGDGPPLLLVHGWPESWYAWRYMMPALAQQYTVIAVDQRGIGLTDKPADGYDAATLASDLAAL